MSINACLYADTAAAKFFHWDFTIEQSIDGWEWTHKDYATNGITGTCQTVFEAIEAADEWRAEGHVLPSMPDPDRQRDDQQDAASRSRATLSDQPLVRGGI